MQKRSELIFNLLLLPIDFLAVTAAFVAAYIIRVRIEDRLVPNPLGILLFLKVFLIIIPVWILIFALLGLYTQSSQRGRLEEMGKAIIGVSGGVMFMILLDFISRNPIFPAKAIPIYGFGLSLAFVIFGRQVVRSLQRWLFNYGVGVQRVLLIGSGPVAARLSADIHQRGSGYRVLGVVDSSKGAARRLKGQTIYASFEEAKRDDSFKELDGFIQADSALEQDEILAMVDYASSHHLGFRFVPNQFGLYAVNSRIMVMSGVPMVEIRKTPLDGWGRIAKRTFDIVGSVAGLVILSPVLALIAIIMKLTDPGPVFYRQRRLSRFGKPINIVKFRSMKRAYSGVDDAKALESIGGPQLVEEFMREKKLSRDPRVSATGSFLRRTSLDEFPQLWNVLRGDLSLVGPRPMLEDELERFGEHLNNILALRCGLTGLWQISGRSDIGFEGRVKMDLYYVENWSLLMDLSIILRTIMVMIRGRGAY